MKIVLPKDFLAEEPRLCREILWRRGVCDTFAAKPFLNPSYESDLHDPYLLKGMKEAVARIFEAVKENKKITIYGDYDVDGTAAAAVLADFFRKVGYKSVSVYIPDREEGYGLSREAIFKIAESGTTLLITVDLGIASYEEVEFAKGLGLEVIVTDHHLPPEILPRSIVVNPKQPGCIYPEKMLCGAGVAFKLVSALIKVLPLPPGQEKWLLDLVALATLADAVPLRGENRTIAYFGLKVLNQTRRPGLQEMKKFLRLREISEEDVVFSIVPRLNSVSRLYSAAFIFETLVTQNPARARELVLKLEETNQERKNIVTQTMREVKRRLVKKEIGKVIVVGDPNWNLGILGLVAGKIAEEYNRPAFVWTRAGDVIKGSCRSPAMNLVSLMKSVTPDFLSACGGHELAGGFTTTIGQIQFLEKALLEVVGGEREEMDDKKGKNFPDGIFSLSDINLENLNIIDRLRPFGKDFAKPVFLFENVDVLKARRFGQGQSHLALSLTDGAKNFEAVSFFEKKDNFGNSVNMLASIERDFRGQPRLRVEKFL